MSLFLFAQFGYIGLYYLGQQAVSDYWLSKSEYNGQVNEVVIPIDLPYWNNQEKYVAVDGSFAYQGKIFRKISQKYQDGKLHVKLVQDYKSQRLHQSIKEWMVSLSDESNDMNRSSHQLVMKAFAKDYFHTSATEFFSKSFTFLLHPNTAYFFSIQSALPTTNTPPPLLG